MNVESWIKKNEANFGSSFEKEFAEKVLAHINAIDLNTVSTQYHFTDLDGKNRYCDFVIQEGSIKIAIEIDGYDKRNTGQGMTHDEFVDWQRRQAALTAYGWHVLRFANRDVMNYPERCKRYIELLLQDQRSKSQHQTKLEEAIGQLTNELQVVQHSKGSSDQTNKLQREINLLKNQLKLAKKTNPLDEKDKTELEQMVAQLEQETRDLREANDRIKVEKNDLEVQKKHLDGDNNTMKTTIWAFTAIIAIFVASGTYIFTSGSSAQDTLTTSINYTSLNQQDQLSNTQPAQEAVNTSSNQPEVTSSSSNIASIPPTSCDSPIEWRNAKDHVDQRVALIGVVKDYRYMPNTRGEPTFINIGERFPNKDRLTVVVWGSDREKFGMALSDRLVGRTVCVIGTVTMRDNSPQISIKWPRELVFM